MDLNSSHFLVKVWTSAGLLPWHWIIAGAHIVLAIIATLHALLFKRDPRAALGWVAVSLSIPIIGPWLYFIFGINRIQTQARKLARHRPFRLRIGHEMGSPVTKSHPDAQETNPLWERFARVSDRVTSRPLTAGNAVELLHNGEQAYPAMLKAINGATERVLLASYLFEADFIGNAFVAALAAARRRGVEVRVITDGIGELYSWPRISRLLRREGIAVVRFLPPRLLPPTFSLNLRNHRKILVVDGRQGFTGGMNIGARHMADADSPRRTVDLHFHLQGPVVADLEEIFAEDWQFMTGDKLPVSISPNRQMGATYCRCISDGPNDDLDRISLVMMGAISAARREVIILTPYFLPSREMIASLQSAALRGVDVTIILPKKSNLRFIDWATRNLLWELLQHEVKIYYQPPPFAHTKLFVIDGLYAQIGSANLDPRSLRLNFELNVEIVGADSVAPLVNYSRDIRREATRITLPQIDGRPLAVRVRDAACWLFMPYL